MFRPNPRGCCFFRALGDFFFGRELKRATQWPENETAEQSTIPVGRPSASNAWDPPRGPNGKLGKATCTRLLKNKFDEYGSQALDEGQFEGRP